MKVVFGTAAGSLWTYVQVQMRFHTVPFVQTVTSEISQVE